MSRVLFTTLMLIAAGVVGLVCAGDKSPVNKNRKNVAVEGYDVVAYFTDARPVKGDAAFSFTYEGAVWWFADQAHLDLFSADPARYAPQYGGYCAWAVSKNSLAEIDPEAWRIVDGKLYLNYSSGIQKKWEKDIPGNIAKADGHWPAVLH